MKLETQFVGEPQKQAQLWPYFYGYSRVHRS